MLRSTASKMGWVSWTAVVAGVALLLASGVAVGQATTEVVRVSEMQSFILDEEIHGACIDEPILVEGVFYGVGAVIQNDNGYHYALNGGTANVTGTGQESGDEYRFINVGSTVGSSLVNGVDIYNTALSFIVITEGPSPNFMMQGTYHQVLHENSHLIVDQGSIHCTPDVKMSRTGTS